jgi:hypothetical protein
MRWRPVPPDVVNRRTIGATLAPIWYEEHGRCMIGLATVLFHGHLLPLPGTMAALALVVCAFNPAPIS